MGPYRYETVSGFVCEAFGYIPRTGESINIILKKAEAEDSQDCLDGETDHQETNKEKFYKYKLEILAGNARKVGAVRFQMGKSCSEEVEVVLPRSAEAFGNVWAKPAESTEEICVMLPSNEDGFCEADSIENIACTPPLEFNLKTDSSSAKTVNSESQRTETATTLKNKCSVIGAEDWDLLTTEQSVQWQDLEKDGKLSSRGQKDTLNQVWVPTEMRAQRRIRWRRKQFAEAAVELDRQRRVEVRRQEVELAMLAMKNTRDKQIGSGSFYKD